MLTIAELKSRFAGPGAVTWIGIRPKRREPMVILDEVEAVDERGLAGDRYRRKAGKRQITLIQAEHLPVIASLLGVDRVSPEQLRRNIVVSGIPVTALKDCSFRIGTAVLEGSGLCHPCSRMDETFGFGGYNATRGHGGITARVIEPGTIRVGDRVEALVPSE